MTFRNAKAGAQNVLATIKKHQQVFVFDTETMGLNPAKDQIIQFSGARYSINPETLEMTEVDWVDTYIKPENPIPEKIVNLTGISDRLVEAYPTEAVMGPQIIDYLQKQPLIAAYNSPFDLKMVDGMATRLNLSFNAPETLDVLVMARDLISKEECASHKLESITQYLYPDDRTQFHSAIEDVRATAKVMQKLLLMYQNILQTEENTLVKLHLEWASYGSNPRKPSEIRIKVNIDKDQEHYGDIFWDVRNHCWSCKKTSTAEKLFASSDIADLERQVLARYGSKYQATNMEELARNWGAAKKANEAITA